MRLKGTFTRKETAAGACTVVFPCGCGDVTLWCGSPCVCDPPSPSRNHGVRGGDHVPFDADQGRRCGDWGAFAIPSLAPAAWLSLMLRVTCSVAQLHQVDTRCQGAQSYIDAGVTIVKLKPPTAGAALRGSKAAASAVARDASKRCTLIACSGIEVDRQVVVEVRLGVVVVVLGLCAVGSSVVC